MPLIKLLLEYHFDIHSLTNVVDNILIYNFNDKDILTLIEYGVDLNKVSDISISKMSIEAIEWMLQNGIVDKEKILVALSTYVHQDLDRVIPLITGKNVSN